MPVLYKEITKYVLVAILFHAIVNILIVFFFLNKLLLLSIHSCLMEQCTALTSHPELKTSNN